MKTLRQLKTFLSSEINLSHDFIKNINSAVNQNQISISSKELGYIYEISFIKIFTAWETFLEKSFIFYLVGKSTSLFKPKKIIREINIEKAYDLIRGTKKYPDWTNIDDIIKMANLFFELGEPYAKIIQTLRPELVKMKTVRNAITHISKNSKQNFISLLRKEIPNYNINITPGEFLSLIINNKELIIRFSEALTFAANTIVKT